MEHAERRPLVINSGKMGKIRSFLFVSLALCSASTAFATDDESSRESLKGLTGVYVVVGDLEPVVEKAGLTKADIQTLAEQELRVAGIPVLSREQWVTTPGGPYLNVNTFVITADNGVWPFYIEVSSMQRVVLERSSVNIFFAPTWSVATVGSVGSNRLLQIKDIIKDYVDQFVKAYRTVNPKE
jgi:hypothetical protein